MNTRTRPPSRALLLFPMRSAFLCVPSTYDAFVYAVDRDQAGVKQLADDLPGVEPVVCDLSDLDAVDALPPVDVLVNNAGLQHVAPVPEFDPARFALILRVMLEAPFRLAR